jgi:hypothetical protein
MCVFFTERFALIIRLERLSEFAPTYFDLASFPKGEMKQALERAAKKKGRALPDSNKGNSTKSSNRKPRLETLDGSDNKGNSKSSIKKAKLEA